MPVYIIDNCQVYSDHRLYFVKVEKFDDEQMKTLLKFCDGPLARRSQTIIGKGELSFFEGRLMTVATFITAMHLGGKWCYATEEERVEGTKLLRRLSKEVLKLVLAEVDWEAP